MCTHTHARTHTRTQTHTNSSCNSNILSKDTSLHRWKSDRERQTHRQTMTETETERDLWKKRVRESNGIKWREKGKHSHRGTQIHEKGGCHGGLGVKVKGVGRGCLQITADYKMNDAHTDHTPVEWLVNIQVRSPGKEDSVGCQHHQHHHHHLNASFLSSANMTAFCKWHSGGLHVHAHHDNLAASIHMVLCLYSKTHFLSSSVLSWVK